MLNFYVGPRNQKGRGIGSLFSGLFRSLSPIANYAKSAFRSFANSDLAKNLASVALDSGKDFAKNIAADFLEGNDISETAKNQLNQAKSKIAQTIRGSGRKRKKKSNDITPSKTLKYSLMDDF